jgi:two-component system chemotaxis response regulator CheY
MKSCLIVDDSKVVRMVARKILEGLNFQIEEAEDGLQALNVCESKVPDVRAMAGIEQPIVIFCTTENDMAHIQEAIGEGANEYIMKPFDSEIIQSKFSQVGLI